MQKWITGIMSALFLVALVSVPVGCGSNEATKLDTTDEYKEYMKAQSSPEARKARDEAEAAARKGG